MKRLSYSYEEYFSSWNYCSKKFCKTQSLKTQSHEIFSSPFFIKKTNLEPGFIPKSRFEFDFEFTVIFENKISFSAVAHSVEWIFF